MSEHADRIIDDQIRRRPGARHAYHHDPTMHGDIERTRGMLTVMEAAMQREGIPYDSAERVLNEIVSAGLDGWERDKRSRERLLLLADMGPSHASRVRQIQDESAVTINQPFTDPGTVSVKDDPEQMGAWIDKMQKQAAEYWRGTEPPERPASGEETSG